MMERLIIMIITVIMVIMRTKEGSDSRKLIMRERQILFLPILALLGKGLRIRVSEGGAGEAR